MASSTFDSSSLYIVPSGIKAGTIFPIKPLGTANLNFARNSNATRVNSAGLIEKVRTNLYPRGSALLSTGWTSVGATLTAGQTDPNGGTTALRVQLAAAQVPYAYILQTFTGSAATYTRSAFIKGATAQSIRIVDPFTGVGTTINLTTSYQRFASVGAGIPPSFGIQFDNDNDDLAKDFTIAFVQIEEGDIATPYIPTTTAAVSVGITADIPRLDYTGGGCPSLLLEPQRTNLALYSEEFDNALYIKSNGTITANSVVSPDGTSSADKFESTSAGVPEIIQSTLNASAKTISVYAKAGNVSNFRIWVGSQVTFDLSNGTVVSGAGTIQNAGNGWYRCIVSNTTFTNFNIYFIASASGQFVYLWGAQLELGAYATSYIPTLGSSVTRLADAASKTGISSLIGQTEGVLFVDFNANGEVIPARSIVYLTEALATANRVAIQYTALGEVQAIASSGGVTQGSVIFAITGRCKAAFAYSASGYEFFVNGVSRGTFSGSLPTSLTRIDFASPIVGPAGAMNGTIDQAALFTTRLTNAELASITSL